jgi:uncharacterized cofD-like protein
MGGGTGLSTLLRGLKRYVSSRRHPEQKLPIADLAAIVTVTDDGGSSGRLRREYRILPPGDIRNCLVALSQDEALLGRLFQYRFQSGRGLQGHSFGNLFLTALTHVTGDFTEAVRLCSEVLAIRGRIFPSTPQLVTLEAVTRDGKVIAGETRISRTRGGIRRVRLVPRRVQPQKEVLEAIRRSDRHGAGVAVHQHHSESAGRGCGQGAAAFAGDASVHRQPDDPAVRNRRLHRR